MKINAEEICLKNNITDDDLKQICKRYLVKEGYDFRKFWIDEIEFEDFLKKNKNLGFWYYHLKLNVTVSPKSIGFVDEPESDDDDDEQKLTFFVKILPKGADGRSNFVEEYNIFEKETELYEFLIPRLQDIAIGAKEWAAQSYLCKDDKVLILEDLRLEGFQLPINSKLGLFDFEHLLVAGTVLGRFHASSMILENRNRGTIPQMYPNTLNENAYPDNENSLRRKGLNNAIDAFTRIIPLIPKYQSDDRAIEVINRELPHLMIRIVEFAKTSSEFRNVFSHGDLWANNFLFLYENDDDSSDESNTESCHEEEGEILENGDNTENEISQVIRELDDHIKSAQKILIEQKQLKPVDARLVDFQLSRYAPPAFDLMTLVFMTSSKVFRQRYFQEICENYYESLRIELDRLGLDVNYELPRDQFWESIEHYKLAGLIETLLVSQLTLLPESKIEELFSNAEEFESFIKDGEKRSKICVECFTENTQYRDRMTELITELIDSYILEVTAL